MSSLTRVLVVAAVLATGLLAGCFPIELSASPDGQVVIPRAEGFCVYDTAKGTLKVAYAPKDQSAVFAQYSPDGKQVLCISAAKGGGMGQSFSVAVLPAAGGEAKEIFSASNLAYVQWSRDGKSVAFARVADEAVAPVKESMPALILVNPADKSQKTLMSNAGMFFRWFPDSKSILAMQVTEKTEGGKYVGKIVQVDAADGKVKALASLVSEKGVFLHLSPDGKKAIFSAIQAGKTDAKLDANAATPMELQELTIATGEVRAVLPKALYAIYSPKGTKVLVGFPDQGNTLKLWVYDAALANGVPVADDAAKASGEGFQTSDIYPIWLDDDTALYLRLRPVYGTDCKNFQLISVDAAGKSRKNHQTAIENGLKD